MDGCPGFSLKQGGLECGGGMVVVLCSQMRSLVTVHNRGGVTRGFDRCTGMLTGYGDQIAHRK